MSSSTQYTPGLPGSLPATLSGNTTNEQIVPNPVQVPVAVSGGVQQQTIALSVSIPANSQLEQKAWFAEATGYITTGGVTNVTAKIYSGNSLTPGNNTLLATSGAIAQNTASAPFLLSISEAVYDSVSGKLTGIAEFLINNTLVVRAAFSNVVTGISNSNNPVLSLCLSFTFSAAFASNKVNVQNFAIDF